MKVFILVVYLFSNNHFYGSDVMPTLEFKSEQECENFIHKLTKIKEVKTKFACIEK